MKAKRLVAILGILTLAACADPSGPGPTDLTDDTNRFQETGNLPDLEVSGDN